MPRKQANEGRIKKSFIIYGHEHGHEYPVNIPLTQILKEFRYSETAYFGVWDTSLQQLQAEDVRSKIILMSDLFLVSHVLASAVTRQKLRWLCLRQGERPRLPLPKMMIAVGCHRI